MQLKETNAAPTANQYFDHGHCQLLSNPTSVMIEVLLHINQIMTLAKLKTALKTFTSDMFLQTAVTLTNSVHHRGISSILF